MTLDFLFNTLLCMCGHCESIQKSNPGPED